MSVSDVIDAAGFWGFLGAFVYGALKLSACLYDEDPGHPRSRCAVDMIVAMMVGAILAAGFVPWAARIVKANDPQAQRALATMIGLLANEAAPRITRMVTQQLLNRIKGGH